MTCQDNVIMEITTLSPNMSNSTSDDFPPYMAFSMTIACTLVFIVGLLGNALVPVVLWANKDLRSSTNFFLLNLSVADLLVLSVCMPPVIVEINHEPEVWLLGRFMCSLVPFVELTVAHVSVLTIIAISVERYYVVTKPLRAGYTCTRMRALLVVGGVWIVGILITCPLLIIAQFDPGKPSDSEASSPTCFTVVNSFWPSFYFIVVITLLYIIPLLLLIVIYSVIARHLVATPYNLQGRQSENSNLRARKQVVAMLAAVVVCFFICLLPFRVFTLWIIMEKEVDIQNVGFHTYYNILNFCRVMQYINSAVNPILYNVMSSKFRDAFSRALGITFGKKELLRSHSRQNTLNTGSTESSSLSNKSKKELMVDPALGVTQLVPQPFITRYGRQGRYVCANMYFQRQCSTASVLNSESNGSVRCSRSDERQMLTGGKSVDEHATV